MTASPAVMKDSFCCGGFTFAGKTNSGREGTRGLPASASSDFFLPCTPSPRQPKITPQSFPETVRKGAHPVTAYSALNIWFPLPHGWTIRSSPFTPPHSPFKPRYPPFQHGTPAAPNSPRSPAKRKSALIYRQEWKDSIPWLKYGKLSTWLWITKV